MQETETYAEDFRGHLSTVDEKGKRIWIYPKAIKGRLYKYRTLVSYVLLAFLFGMPHIYLHGEPFLLFDIIHRKFILFGQIFYPQDFYLFVFGSIGMVLFIILFTIAFGRFFCGWICPQTIFLEMVFRKIERWIEGDHNAQRKLNQNKWHENNKLLKKSVKHIIFFGISYVVANTFLAYIIGSRELFHIQTDTPSNHITGLVAITIFSAAFYGVFAFFREQVCTNVCPYGRLQGVLLDKNSIVVAYDRLRGEPREKSGKNRNTSAGSCIDCRQCVLVCPTGIDIRNGTQLECVNCTACIDACDDVMLKIKQPTGLIKYASEKQISEGGKFVFTARLKAYSAVLIAIIIFFNILMVMRGTVETTILRARGQNFTVMDDGRISNLYKYKIINKSNEKIPLKVSLVDVKGEIELIGQKNLVLQPEEKKEGIMMIKIDSNEVRRRTNSIKIRITHGDVTEEITSVFMAPRKSKK
ncbi:MAG: cytochrome c oxidase accessory protein CcoG [Flavobacteriales bacterium]